MNIVILVLILICNFLEILVYNEEAIIVICFILFLSFSYKTLGNGIASDLDDRSFKITEELNKSAALWKSSQSELLASWTSIFNIFSEIESIFLWSKKEVNSLVSVSVTGVISTSAETINSRLSYLASQEIYVRSVVRQSILSSFFSVLSMPNDSKVWYQVFKKKSFEDTNHRLFSTFRVNSFKILQSSVVAAKSSYISKLSNSSLNLSFRLANLESIIAKLITS